MPELPDVQVFKEYVDATSLHQPIEHVYLSAADMLLEDVSRTTLRRRLKGTQLASTQRHGKHLFARLAEDGWLRLHFGMSGRPEYYRDGEGGPDPEHTRLRLDFEGGGHLAYISVRRLGEIGLVDDPDVFVAEHGLGPDALDPAFDAGALADALEGGRSTIKSALMHQERVAGIGNIYSDEILFQARIHPKAEAGALDRTQVRRIYRQIRRVLEAAVEARVEEFPDWFLLPRRNPGGRCPRCGGELEQTRVSGRRAWFCPVDQAEGG